jgi:Tol biopolymer transport system component
MMVGRRLLFCGLVMCLAVFACSGVDKGPPGPVGPSVNNGVGGNASNDVIGGAGRIAYMRRSLESGSFHIYLITPDGKTEINLNDEADLATYSGPSWSPDGQQIAFASDRSGNANYNIYVMNLDGSNLRAVVEDTGGDFAPSWSPDGQKILFQAWRNNTTRWDIYVVNVDGSGEQVLAGTTLDEQLPTWSPDGSKILYQAGRDSIGTDIFVANADGSGVARLTSGNGRLHSSPAWSPDGSLIAFESNLHQAVVLGVTPIAEYELYVMNADGSNIKRMTFDGGANSQVRNPTWSPDGSQIAFEYVTIFQDAATPFTTLVVMRLDATNVYGIPNLPNGGIFPRWSPM